MKKLSLEKIDPKNSFFHYTSRENLDKISRNGLLPKLGKNSRGIEKTAKIFFVRGENGFLTIIDAWLRWLIFKPNSRAIYVGGAWAIRKIPGMKIVGNMIFSRNIKSTKKREKAYKNFAKILENSILLKLEIREKIDFDYDDFDEAKLAKNSRKMLNAMYTYDDVNSHNNRVEFWNLHTKNGVKIAPEKLRKIVLNDDDNLMKIVKFLMTKNEKYVRKNLPYLREFFAKMI